MDAYDRYVTVLADPHSTKRQHELKGTPEPGRISIRRWLMNVRSPESHFNQAYENAQRCRDLKERGEEYHHIKRNLPCIKPSGLFDTSDGDKLIQHSGWMQIDLDKSDNPEFLENIERAKQELAKLPEVGYVARSTTDGIWALVKLPDDEEITEEDHEAYFRGMKQALQEFGIRVDSSCKNPGRLRFYSYDPNPIWKPIKEVKPFRNKVTPEQRERPLLSNSGGGGVRSIEEAQRIIERQGHRFQDGSKHGYLFALASVCNKMAIPYEDLQEYVDEHLMAIEEITTNCLNGPYERFEDEYDTWE